MMQNRFFSISLWASLAVLAALSGLTADWPINRWSVAYLGRRLDPDIQGIALPAPPENHPHAGIWLAEEAVVQGEHQRAQAWMPVLEAIASENVLAAHTLGRVWWAQGKIADAVQIWLHARDYQSLSKAAREAQEAGRLEDALRAYHAARVIDPEAGTLPLVNFLWQQKSYGSAEGLLRQTLVLFSGAKNDLAWQHRLGELLRAQKRWEDALVVYQQLLSENPDDWWGHIGLGWVLYESGAGLEPAEAKFREVIALAPKYGEGYQSMGQILVKEGRYAESDAWFAQAIQYNPDAKKWRLTRANTTRTAGNVEQALRLYADTAVRFPDWAPVYYEMAWAYKLVEQPADAVQTIGQALALMQPPDGWYYYRAGQIYEWNGMLSQALDAYTHALVLMPKNKEIEDAVGRLRDLGTPDK